MRLERFNSHQVPNAWEENNSATADHQAVAACWSEGKQQLLYDFTTPAHFSATSQGISTSQRSWFFSATPLTSWKKGWGIQTGEPRLVFTLLLPRKSRNFHLTAACCSFMEMASAAPSCRGQTCRCRGLRTAALCFCSLFELLRANPKFKGKRLLLQAVYACTAQCTVGFLFSLLAWVISTAAKRTWVGKKREKIKASAFTHEQNMDVNLYSEIKIGISPRKLCKGWVTSCWKGKELERILVRLGGTQGASPSKNERQRSCSCLLSCRHAELLLHQGFAGMQNASSEELS